MTKFLHNLAFVLGQKRQIFGENISKITTSVPDPKSGKYNAAVITKLVRNFRSHESILKIPSELFYNSELQPSADRDKVESMLGSSFLPNPKFPIVFEGVVGQVPVLPKVTNICIYEYIF
jgi:hypothetical protein